MFRGSEQSKKLGRMQSKYSGRVKYLGIV